MVLAASGGKQKPDPYMEALEQLAKQGGGSKSSGKVYMGDRYLRPKGMEEKGRLLGPRAGWVSTHRWR